MDGQAELTWVGCHKLTEFIRPQMVTYKINNWVRHWLTLLTQPMMLPPKLNHNLTLIEILLNHHLTLPPEW